MKTIISVMINGFFFFFKTTNHDVNPSLLIYRFSLPFYFPVKIRNTTDCGINENKHNDAVR